MDAAVAGLVGALGGAGLGFISSLKISSDQRREAQRLERQRAFAVYLGALYPAVAELREMPANKEPNVLTKIIDQVSGEQASWMRTRKGVIAMSPHMFGRLDRLSAAVALVQALDMPASVISAFDRANDYVAALGEERTEERLATWPDIQEQLLAAAQLLRK